LRLSLRGRKTHRRKVCQKKMRRQKRITATTTIIIIIIITTTTTIKGEFSDSADGGLFVRRRFLAKGPRYMAKTHVSTGGPIYGATAKVTTQNPSKFSPLFAAV